MASNGVCAREGAASEKRAREGKGVDKELSPLSMPTNGGFIPLGDDKFMDEETGEVYGRRQIPTETSHAENNDYELPRITWPSKYIGRMVREIFKGFCSYFRPKRKE